MTVAPVLMNPPNNTVLLYREYFCTILKHL